MDPTQAGFGKFYFAKGATLPKRDNAVRRGIKRGMRLRREFSAGVPFYPCWPMRKASGILVGSTGALTCGLDGGRNREGRW